MFDRSLKVGSDSHIFNDNVYEISVYKDKEDGRLRGCASFGEVVVEMTGDTASDAKHDGKDPVEMLIKIVKGEIDAGKFPGDSNA